MNCWEAVKPKVKDVSTISIVEALDALKKHGFYAKNISMGQAHQEFPEISVEYQFDGKDSTKLMQFYNATAGIKSW